MKVNYFINLFYLRTIHMWFIDEHTFAMNELLLNFFLGVYWLEFGGSDKHGGIDDL
jgi:hypothetical protein